MASETKVVKVRGGEELGLRLAHRSDEKALLAFYQGLPDEDRGFLKEDATSGAVVRRWLEAPADDTVRMLGVHNGEVVAEATLHRDRYGWSKHVGEVRAVVAHHWQRKGVAQALLRELVAKASELGLELLEAHVLQGHHGGQHAFEGLGFQVETVLRGRAVDRSGRKCNVLLMTIDVAELWRQMDDVNRELDYSRDGY